MTTLYIVEERYVLHNKKYYIQQEVGLGSLEQLSAFFFNNLEKTNVYDKCFEDLDTMLTSYVIILYMALMPSIATVQRAATQTLTGF